jgi:hypothetical protein
LPCARSERFASALTTGSGARRHGMADRPEGHADTSPVVDAGEVGEDRAHQVGHVLERELGVSAVLPVDCLQRSKRRPTSGGPRSRGMRPGGNPRSGSRRSRVAPAVVGEGDGFGIQRRWAVGGWREVRTAARGGKPLYFDIITSWKTSTCITIRLVRMVLSPTDLIELGTRTGPTRSRR